MIEGMSKAVDLKLALSPVYSVCSIQITHKDMLLSSGYVIGQNKAQPNKLFVSSSALFI